MAEPLIVVHKYTTWLNLTVKWMYDQIRLLPPDIVSHVVCEQAVHLDLFPYPRLHLLSDRPRIQQFLERAIRRSRLQHHLPLLARVAKREHAQLLHSHFGDLAWANLAVARRLGIAHVVTFYGADVQGAPKRDARWYARYRQLFAEVDRVLCEGPFMADCLHDLGCPRSKLQVHHLGVDFAALPYSVRSWRPGEELRVLVAGTFREKKGIPDAMTALGLLKQRRPELQIRVTLLGDAASEPDSHEQKSKIFAVIAKFGLEVNALGYRPHADLVAEYQRNHIFLSPSVLAADGDSEGGAPITILEAAATGMPVVSTTHCDIPNVLPVEAHDLLVPEHSPERLADALEILLDSPERWPSLARAQREHVEREFSAVEQSLRLARIYRDVVATRA